MRRGSRACPRKPVHSAAMLRPGIRELSAGAIGGVLSTSREVHGTHRPTNGQFRRKRLNDQDDQRFRSEREGVWSIRMFYPGLCIFLQNQRVLSL